MLVVLAVLCVCAVARGDEDFKAECSNDNLVVSMEPAGTLPGRYVVQYCTHTSPPLTKWELWLYTMNRPSENCTNDEKNPIHHSNVHSYVEEMLNSSSINSSCPYVCFSRPMDLIFGSCYRIVNRAGRKGRSKGSTMYSELSTKHIYIKNNITRNQIINTSAYVECNSYGEKVVCTWFEGLIPYTKYRVELIPNMASKDESTELTVTDNCTLVAGAVPHGAGALRCELAVTPGAYMLQLQHFAPWANGFNDLVYHRGYFNYSLAHEEHAVPSTASASVAWWSCGAVLLAALSLFTGLVVYQKRQKLKLKVQILKSWQCQARKASELTPESNPECPCVPNPVLLLYARDCPAAQRAAAALKQLLRDQHGGQVLDLYDADTVARTAAASNAFVHSCMSAPSVRVVLLQTPALAALHTTTLRDSLTLSSPLLPRHAVYRDPHCADGMFQYALRLLQETNNTTELPYRKYFLCTLSSLPVDAFPDVVPFTRFSLPEDAAALLLALKGSLHPASPSPPALPPGALDELMLAHAALVQYVSENPSYLADRITFLRER